MLRCTASREWQLSTECIATEPPSFVSFIKLVSVAEQLQPSSMLPSAISCCGVPHAATGLQSSPDVCSRVRNHTFPFKNVSHNEVHKEMDEQVWCRNLTGLHRVLTRALLGWIRLQTESQAFSCNIIAARHWLARGGDHHRPTAWSEHEAAETSPYKSDLAYMIINIRSLSVFWIF